MWTIEESDMLSEFLTLIGQEIRVAGLLGDKKSKQL